MKTFSLVTLAILAFSPSVASAEGYVSEFGSPKATGYVSGYGTPKGSGYVSSYGTPKGSGYVLIPGSTRSTPPSFDPFNAALGPIDWAKRQALVAVCNQPTRPSTFAWEAGLNLFVVSGGISEEYDLDEICPQIVGH